MSGDILRKLEHLQTVWHLKRAHAHACAHMQTHFSVSPELVPLHSMAVIEGHRAAVGNGIKAELLGMLRISWPDVLPPAEGEYLSGQTGPSPWLLLGMIPSPAEGCSLCPQGRDGFKERTASSRGKTPPTPLARGSADQGTQHQLSHSIETRQCCCSQPCWSAWVLEQPWMSLQCRHTSRIK